MENATQQRRSTIPFAINGVRMPKYASGTLITLTFLAQVQFLQNFHHICAPHPGCFDAHQPPKLACTRPEVCVQKLLNGSTSVKASRTLPSST